LHQKVLQHQLAETAAYFRSLENLLKRSHLFTDPNIFSLIGASVQDSFGRRRRTRRTIQTLIETLPLSARRLSHVLKVRKLLIESARDRIQPLIESAIHISISLEFRRCGARREKAMQRKPATKRGWSRTEE
jgi:hypothetical protein